MEGEKDAFRCQVEGGLEGARKKALSPEGTGWVKGWEEGRCPGQGPRYLLIW